MLSAESLSLAAAVHPHPQAPSPLINTQQQQQTAAASMVGQHNHRIHALYVRQQFDECSALIDKALADGRSGGGNLPASCEYALHVQGLIQRQRGRIQESLKLFQQATALNPHNTANLKQVGRSLFLLGRHRAAAEVYDEALKQAGDDWELWLNKAMCAAQLRDYDGALQCCQAANQIQPQDSTYLQMGAVHAERGDVEAALATYLEALQHSPDNPELLTTLGVSFLRLGDNQRAFDSLGTALSHDQKNPRALLAAGSIMQDHGDADVALVKYRIAASPSVTPNSPQLWNNIGCAFHAKQRFIAAIACLRRALYLGPLEWVVAHNLGLLHLCTGQAASAFHFLSTAVNLQPDFAHSYMAMGMALSQLDDADNAAAAYAKAISLAPAEPLLHLNYAVALYNAGDLAAAQLEVAEVRRLTGAASSSDPEVEERAAQLEQLLLEA